LAAAEGEGSPIDPESAVGGEADPEDSSELVLFDRQSSCFDDTLQAGFQAKSAIFSSQVRYRSPLEARAPPRA